MTTLSYSVVSQCFPVDLRIIYYSKRCQLRPTVGETTAAAVLYNTVHDCTKRISREKLTKNRVVRFPPIYLSYGWRRLALPIAAAAKLKP